jgi:hypothetical protein
MSVKLGFIVTEDQGMRVFEGKVLRRISGSMIERTKENYKMCSTSGETINTKL